MLNGALATREAQKKRKCTQNDLCPICGIEVETIEHMILLCPWANRCWFGCSLSLLVQRDQALSIKKRCEDIFLRNKGITEEGRALVAAICWGIWKGRCDWVFNATKVDAERVIAVATLLVKEVWEAKADSDTNMNRRRTLMIERKQEWKAPEEGTVKINADGAFLKQSGCAGVGIVCRNWHGRFLGGLRKKINACSPFEDECLALREALLASDRFQGRKICVEIDSEELYKAVLAGSTIKVEWHSISTLANVLLLIEERPNVVFPWSHDKVMLLQILWQLE